MRLRPSRNAVTVVLTLIWAAVWAGSFVATKLALRSMDPFTIVAVRCLAAGTILCCLSVRRAPSAASLLRVGALGLLTNAGYLTFMAVGLPGITSGLAALISSSTPVLVLFGDTVWSRRGTRFLYAGVLLALSGVTLSSIERLWAGSATMWGVGFAGIAVVCLAAGTLLTPGWVAPGSSLMFTAGWQSLVGGLAVLPIALLQRDVELTPESSLAVIYLVFVGSGLGLWIWQHLICSIGAGKASTAHFLPPLFGMFLGHLLLDETITVLQCLTVVPVIVGVVLATTSSTR